MNAVEQILPELPVNNLNLYMELGHKAGEQGRIKESIEWYKKGLEKARSLKDQQRIREFSGLIFTLL